MQCIQETFFRIPWYSVVSAVASTGTRKINFCSLRMDRGNLYWNPSRGCYVMSGGDTVSCGAATLTAHTQETEGRTDKCSLYRVSSFNGRLPIDPHLSPTGRAHWYTQPTLCSCITLQLPAVSVEPKRVRIAEWGQGADTGISKLATVSSRHRLNCHHEMPEERLTPKWAFDHRSKNLNVALFLHHSVAWAWPTVDCCAAVFTSESQCLSVCLSLCVFVCYVKHSDTDICIRLPLQVYILPFVPISGTSLRTVRQMRCVWRCYCIISAESWKSKLVPVDWTDSHMRILQKSSTEKLSFGVYRTEMDCIKICSEWSFSRINEK